MDQPSRKEQIATVFTRKAQSPRITPSSTTSAPGSTVPAVSLPPTRVRRETPNTTATPVATPNLSAIVSAAQSSTDTSDTEDSVQDPMSIIGQPATRAAFVDKVANVFGLAEVNHSGLHSFSKVYTRLLCLAVVLIKCVASLHPQNRMLFSRLAL